VTKVHRFTPPTAWTPTGPLDAHGLECLDRTTCLRLLGDAAVARIGVTMGALPVVLPVNFTLARPAPGDEPVLVVRTGRGTKLSAAAAHAIVAVETDQYDPIDHAGWSVLVQGESRIVDRPDEIEWAAALPLRPWAIPDAECFIAISTAIVSGRRFGHV
jgi:nitroimidazol reductase NimA-like FMN-containing flavoprotein (pyridoxamine 5'-phosphate oxidase superfamily)